MTGSTTTGKTALDLVELTRIHDQLDNFVILGSISSLVTHIDVEL